VDYPDEEWLRNTLKAFSGGFYWLEATRAAVELGGPIMLNMIMLGALCALRGFPLTGDDIKPVLEDIFQPAKLKSNFRALSKGRELIGEDVD
jgi:indolepyruvate ferredoxin oxidoreductase beta subunit